MSDRSDFIRARVSGFEKRGFTFEADWPNLDIVPPPRGIGDEDLAWFKAHKFEVLSCLLARDGGPKPYLINGRRPCPYGDPRHKDYSPKCNDANKHGGVHVHDGIGTCSACVREQIFSDFTKCRVEDCSGWLTVIFGRGRCEVCGMEHLFAWKPNSDEPIDASGPWLTWYEAAASRRENRPSRPNGRTPMTETQIDYFRKEQKNIWKQEQRER